ncbi:MAG: tetratricopeptide repeat protein [Spirochaetales bacterium]|nr:tetratricopeptide repeat protein [Spirochaetales bacterium]
MNTRTGVIIKKVLKKPPFLFCLAVLLSLASVNAFAEDKPDAQALYNDKKYDEAIKACQQILVETPKDMDAYNIIGMSYLEMKKYEDALRYAEEALEVARFDRRIILIAGEANYFLGRNENALKYLEEFANIATSDKRIKYVYYYMGEIYLRYGEFSNADISFSTACYYDKEVAEWWAKAAYAREMAKDYFFSLDAYKKALALNPNMAEAKRGSARVKKLMGE